MKTGLCRQAIIFATFVTVVGWAGLAPADPVSFKILLSSAQSVPPVELGGQRFGRYHL